MPRSATPLLCALILLITLPLHGQLFTRITATPFDTAADARSINWVDVNQDGWQDCFVSNGPQGGQNNALYLNDGNGGFTPLTGDPIVTDMAPSDGATFADCDNDGDLDGFVVNWYGVNNMLFLNDGDGTFTRITNQVLATQAGYSETAAWGDYDLDGLVDLYVTNSAGTRKNFLYHNNGNGSFSAVTTGTLVTDTDHSRSANWTDIDLDGDPDLFVTNENGEDEVIYRNDGAGVFVKMSSGALLNHAGNTMSGSWGDIDNDGDFDVFLANDAGYNAIFRNDGNFVFTGLLNDTTARTYAHSFSSAWADADNDADLDLVVTNAFSGSALSANFLYLNDGQGNFSRVSGDPVTTAQAWTYGCAFGDYDNDGFQDLALATTRFNNADAADQLFHNNGNGNHWLLLRLEGTVSNRAAIGVRVQVCAQVQGNARCQWREISAQSSYCGQNDLRAHFGLADATVADSVRIFWPSGRTETYPAVQADQILHIVEGQGIQSRPDAAPQGRLRISPNPVRNSLTLHTSQQIAAGEVVEILNSQGQICARIGVENRTMNLHIGEDVLSKLPAGVYFIRCGGLTARFLRL